VLGVLRQRFPGRWLGAVGFSLGGNVLLKYLGEAAGAAAAAAAVAISVPFDLAAGAVHLERGFGRAYRRYLVRKLQRKTRAKAAMLRLHVSLERVAGARTVEEFDDAATAPLHGFMNAQDYYAKCSRAAGGGVLGGAAQAVIIAPHASRLASQLATLPASTRTEDSKMPTSHATAVWNGKLKDGNGHYAAGTGTFKGDYTFATRFEGKKGTNPEELIAAAHAACFSMALSAGLEKAGTPATKITTKASCTLEAGGGGSKITKMRLETRGVVAGIDQVAFQKAAETAKDGCPVSGALKGNVAVELDARLDK